MRIALLTSLLLTACTVGETGTGTGSPSNGTPDAGTGGGGSGNPTGNGGTDPNACVNRVPDAQAPPAYQHTAGGTSNAGKNCIVAGCHVNNNKGDQAPGFQFAGTVYLSGTTKPAAGVTVRIRSADMTLTPVVTDSDGNFYFPAGGLPGTFTATTDVTGCPTVKPMVTKLQSGSAGSGSCNLCHATSGGTTTPIYF